MASTNNLSNYTAQTGAKITYDSIEEAYLLKKLIRDGVATILLNNIQLSNNVKISYDIKLNTGTTNLQPRISLFNGNTGVCGRIIYSTRANVYRIAIQQHTKNSDGSSEIAYTDYTPSVNTYYNMEVIFNNGNVVVNLKDNNVIVASVSGNESILSDSNELGFVIGLEINASAFIKNIRLVEL